PSTWVGATVEAGECAVVYGGAAVGGAGTFQLSSLNGASGFVIQGIKAFDKLGWFCAGGGDANGDGVADGLATAYGGSSNDGEAYVCLGISPFVAPYGTGTQGCSGFHTLGANAPPNVGSPGFALVASAAPPSSLGLLLVGDAQNAAGSDSLGIFLVFHVDLFASTLLVGFDMPSDLAGEALASVPIPASPSIAGATLYAQGIFQWRPTGPCFPSPFRLSSTPGLSLVLQP
ncbi:MAG TPA: hypothetical protein VKE69_10460, partial [Planctomycetota bacterium]|nr:hypothetical protein [Planctomycetota bacterium]